MHSVRFLLAVLLAAAPFGAQAGCRIQAITRVPLSFEHGRAVVSMAINETPGQFILDTGAATTMLAASYVRRSHAGIDSHPGQYVYTGAGNKDALPAFNVHARHIQIGDISFQDWEFGALPGELSEDGSVSGLLGRDFMHYFDMELDFPAGKMTVWRLYDCKDVAPPWKGDYDTIPMTKIKDTALTVPIWIDNAFLDVIFDTGGSLLLTHAAALRAGATNAQLARDEQAEGRGIGGDFSSARHQFGMLLVGRGQFKSPEIPVDPLPVSTIGAYAYSGTDGLIGLEHFRGDRLWISFGTSALFVQSPAQAEAQAGGKTAGK